MSEETSYSGRCRMGASVMRSRSYLLLGTVFVVFGVICLGVSEYFAHKEEDVRERIPALENIIDGRIDNLIAAENHRSSWNILLGIENAVQLMGKQVPSPSVLRSRIHLHESSAIYSLLIGAGYTDSNPDYKHSRQRAIEELGLQESIRFGYLWDAPCGGS